MGIYLNPGNHAFAEAICSKISDIPAVLSQLLIGFQLFLVEL